MDHQRFSNQRQATDQGTIWHHEGGQEDGEHALEDITPEKRNLLERHLQPGFPTWPTSRPGPLASLPAPGNTPVNKCRSEQMAEVDYNQETGMAGTNNPLRYWPDESQRERVGFDQLVTGQEKMEERYHRPSDTAYQEILDAQKGTSLSISGVRTIEDILHATVFPLTLNTFHTAMRATGMEYVLEGRKPLTVFAPTDIGFSLLRYGTIYDLLKNITALTHLIEYHLVPLKLTTTSLRYLASTTPLPSARDTSLGEEIQEIALPTLSGHVITASLSREVLIEGVRVLQADIEAENVVVHLVEKVLWPSDLKKTDFGTRSPLSVRR